ncbi:hypothetical protein LTR37_002287 [Vermiconidia calcicola]|uniref:Uncharacterized protein n=1 Tax=Vermiconidia calcicola TaxID=1690605 RepID=A0ACC3NTK0_9PEZI|nr:hypothetical protein LTR37_002287 [Vermiconidia calcicola]
MHFTSIALASGLLMLGLVLCQDTCQTKSGTKSIQIVPTTTTTIHTTITTTVRATRTPKKTVTPMPVITLSTYTFTYFETTTMTMTSTGTVPTPAGFTPISQDINYVPKIRGRSASELEPRVNAADGVFARAGRKYPTAVKCTITITHFATKTSTMIAPTETVTKPPWTFTGGTTTETTITITQTMLAPDPQLTFAACSGSNIVSTANGGFPIRYIWTATGTHEAVANLTTPEDCCAACHQIPYCRGSWFFDLRENDLGCHILTGASCDPGSYHYRDWDGNQDSYQSQGDHNFRYGISVPDYCGTLRSFLNNRNYLFKQSSKKPRLNRLATRAQRCLPSYETCSIKELKAICAQQRLQLSGLEKKQDLVDRLELEDESRTFNAFLDLPAELRNVIYFMHFDGFDAMDVPFPPPITTVSKQLRQETLLLFFRSCTFAVDLWNPGVHDGMFRQDRMDASWATKQVFTRLPTNYLGSIRQIQIEAPVFAQHGWRKTRWEVKVRSGDGTVSVQPFKRPYYCDAEPLDQERFPGLSEKVEGRLKQEFGAIAARHGEMKLQRADLGVLFRIFSVKDQ